VLKKLSPTLKAHAGIVTIEGHADPHVSAGIWGSDWNLAAARANSVLVYLIDDKAISPTDISSISFGSEHAKTGSSEAAVEHNRRVDIVLHSVQAPTATTGTASTTSTASKKETASKTATATKTGTASKPEPTASSSAKTEAGSKH